jgi:hypothetical protein
MALPLIPLAIGAAAIGAALYFSKSQAAQKAAIPSATPFDKSMPVAYAKNVASVMNTGSDPGKVIDAALGTWLDGYPLASSQLLLLAVALAKGSPANPTDLQNLLIGTVALEPQMDATGREILGFIIANSAKIPSSLLTSWATKLGAKGYNISSKTLTDLAVGHAVASGMYGAPISDPSHPHMLDKTGAGYRRSHFGW